LLCACIALSTSAQYIGGKYSISVSSQYGQNLNVESPYQTRILKKYTDQTVMLNYWLSPKLSLGTGMSQVAFGLYNHRLGTNVVFRGLCSRSELRAWLPVGEKLAVNLAAGVDFNFGDGFKVAYANENNEKYTARASAGFFNAGLTYKALPGLYVSFSPLNMMLYNYSSQPGTSGYILQNGFRLNYANLRLDYNF
jgi:hypothetical protein